MIYQYFFSNSVLCISLFLSRLALLFLEGQLIYFVTYLEELLIKINW